MLIHVNNGSDSVLMFGFGKTLKVILILEILKLMI